MHTRPNYPALLGLDLGSLAGILSERDLVRGLVGADDDYNRRPVSELMTSDVKSCSPRDDIEHVAQTVAACRIRHLPVLDRGRLLGCISIRDVEELRTQRTDRKIEMLLESNDGYTKFLQNCPDAIYIQVDGTIVFANAKANEIFGADHEHQLIGLPSLDLFHPDDADFVHWRRQSHRSESATMPLVECRRVRLDGSEFHGESAATSIMWDGKNAILAVVRNVDQRKDLELRLRESERLNAIGQLAGGVAHDFNNLLMVISGFTVRALNASGDPGEVVSALSEVATAVEKAARLTKQLLMFSRRQVMETTVFPVSKAVRELEPLLSPLLGSTIDLTVEIEDEDACIETDSNELTQALMNLATNARDAMPNGGELTISVALDGGHRAPDATESQSDSTVQDSANVIITVRDNGMGMPIETASRVFEPFFTTKEQGKGTGLGLAMVYGFVQESGGKIDLHSEPGRGTTVTISLPRVQNRPQVSVTSKDHASIQAKGEIILVAEDDDALRRLAQANLEELGYTVLAASDGLDALEIEDDFEGRIDLLLSDVVMPGLGGFDLVRTIKQTRPDIKVLLISGYPARGDLKQIDPPEGVHVLQKPLDPQTLARSIRDALDEGETAGSAPECDRLAS
jgi:PAS domain S-box-containing protein